MQSLPADNPFLCSAFRRKLGELGGGGAGWLGHLAESCPEYQVLHSHLSTGSLKIIMERTDTNRKILLKSSVPDPLHFGVDSDPPLTNGVGSGSCLFCH